MKKVLARFFFIILIFCYSVSIAEAEQLTIQFEDPSIYENQIKAFVSIMGNISYDTVDAIRNGITAKFLITFQLSQSARFMGKGKNTFLERVEAFNLSYDVWENSFIVDDRKRRNSHHALSPAEIIQTINHIISPLAIERSSIGNADRLYLRAKIKIQTIKLFPPFGIFLLFIDPWNYESDWVSTEVVISDIH